MSIFGPLVCVDDLGRDRDVGQRLASVVTAVAVDEQERGQRDGVAGLAGDPVDLEDVADGDLVLPAAGADDRVHG